MKVVYSFNFDGLRRCGLEISEIADYCVISYKMGGDFLR